MTLSYIDCDLLPCIKMSYYLYYDRSSYMSSSTSYSLMCDIVLWFLMVIDVF
jgi:hypothetical protein